MMDARKFLILFRGEAKRVIGAIERRPNSREPNIAAIEAILSCVYLIEQYTGAQRGLGPILKPIVLAVLREHHDLHTSLGIIIKETTRQIEVIDGGVEAEAEREATPHRV